MKLTANLTYFRTLWFYHIGSVWEFFLVFPLLGLRVSPFTLWVPTLHTEGLQQSEVSSVQPASLRLRWVYVSAISVCFRTPRLSLGHPGSLTSVHDLKCMRTQTAPLFNAPRGRRGNRAQVSFPRIHPVTWTGIEPTTLGLWVRRAIHSATAAPF